MLKKIPLWYIIVISIFIAYGILSIYLNETLEMFALLSFAIINLIVTVVFLFFNIVMLGFFANGNCKEGMIISVYYIVLNSLNAFNIQYQWIESYEFLRNVAIITKIIEIGFIIRYFKNRP